MPGWNPPKRFSGDVQIAGTSFSPQMAISEPERSSRNAEAFHLGKASGMRNFRESDGFRWDVVIRAPLKWHWGLQGSKATGEIGKLRTFSGFLSKSGFPGP